MYPAAEHSGSSQRGRAACGVGARRGCWGPPSPSQTVRALLMISRVINDNYFLPVAEDGIGRFMGDGGSV